MLLHVQLDGSERVIPLTELEEMVRSGQIGPETPVRGESLTGDRWIPAGELEFFRGLRDSPHARLRQAWANPGLAWFTALLVGVELRIFLWTHGSVVGSALIDRYARYTPAIVEGGELWRLVTYGFLHGSLGHVLMNLVFIAYVGVALEGIVGSVNLAVFFLGSVFWGGAVSALLSPANPSIGASAGDFGYLAGAAVFGLRYLDLLPARARPRFGFMMLLFVIYMLLNGFFAEKGIDNWGHVGGLVAGGLHMAALRPNVGAAWRAHNRLTSVTALLLMAVGTATMARVPIPLTPIEEDGLTASRPLWWSVAWSATGERGWASPVNGSILVARTLERDAPTTSDEAAEALLRDYRAVDPLAAVTEDVPVTRDEVPGRHLRIGYEHEGVLRRVDAEVFGRGRYVHRVVLDVPVDATRVAALWKRVFASVELPLPEKVAEAQTSGRGWRAQLEQARAAAAIGHDATARTLLRAARVEAPREPAVHEALLTLEASYPTADTPRLVEEALAAFPLDRGVREAAVRALLAAGSADEARRRLDEARAAAPGDRRLDRLQEQLFGP